MRSVSPLLQQRLMVVLSLLSTVTLRRRTKSFWLKCSGLKKIKKYIFRCNHAFTLNAKTGCPQKILQRNEAAAFCLNVKRQWRHFNLRNASAWRIVRGRCLQCNGDNIFLHVVLRMCPVWWHLHCYEMLEGRHVYKHHQHTVTKHWIDEGQNPLYSG